MAHLSSADDVALRNNEEESCWSIRRKHFRIFAVRACQRSSAKKSTWDHGPSSSSAAMKHAAQGTVSALPSGESGIVYTRTGRRFFNDPNLETAIPDVAICNGRRRVLGRVQHRLGVPGLRTDALVGQSAGTAAITVCRGWIGRPSFLAGRCFSIRESSPANERRTSGGCSGTSAPAPGSSRKSRKICGGVPAILLASHFAG